MELTTVAHSENLCCPMAADGMEICLRHQSNGERQAIHTLTHAFAGIDTGEYHQIHQILQGQLQTSKEAEVQQKQRLGILRRTAKLEYERK